MLALETAEQHFEVSDDLAQPRPPRTHLSAMPRLRLPWRRSSVPVAARRIRAASRWRRWGLCSMAASSPPRSPAFTPGLCTPTGGSCGAQAWPSPADHVLADAPWETAVGIGVAILLFTWVSAGCLLSRFVRERVQSRG